MSPEPRDSGAARAAAQWRRDRSMITADLEAARQKLTALKLIVARHVGSEADPRALRRVVDLCGGLSQALEDDYCREKVRVVAEYGSEMLAHGEPHRWGIDFLKQQIIAALELIDSRLYSLEFLRRAAGHPAALHPR
jgi:hypothetical protein